jgi:hypothetical protein
MRHSWSQSAQPVVCGVRAESMSITYRPPDMMDITTGFDYARVYAQDPLARGRTLAEFSFLLTNNGDYEHLRNLFRIGPGNCETHELGPADVCQYCGTAWLPGTFVCPSCGGTTDHHDAAIEYASKNDGLITCISENRPYDGVVRLSVDIEFYEPPQIDHRRPQLTFAHHIWNREAAIWICRYCGHVVRGEKVSCPGCGGKRQPIDKLASQARECLWCGAMTTGGYSCKRCNMRLRAAVN